MLGQYPDIAASMKKEAYKQVCSHRREPVGLLCVSHHAYLLRFAAWAAA